ncbi:hypothetical protein [Haloarcula pelagica]|uniref:hypothetical protein n=1 Tax=Haloarcula pelagica TaxID=3033389 RepID=UPI0024C404C3|nr:hypothetical protein [Halomicroarcula sp. YJ-61-S]
MEPLVLDGLLGPERDAAGEATRTVVFRSASTTAARKLTVPAEECPVAGAMLTALYWLLQKVMTISPSWYR